MTLNSTRAERVYFNFGILSIDRCALTNAEVRLRKRIEFKLEFGSALFNLTLLFSDSDRPMEAQFLYQQIKYHTFHNG